MYTQKALVFHMAVTSLRLKTEIQTGLKLDTDGGTNGARETAENQSNPGTDIPTVRNSTIRLNLCNGKGECTVARV